MESGSSTLSADAQAILESMGDAFYALDAAWRIIYANQRALTFWGVEAGDVIFSGVSSGNASRRWSAH